MRGWVMEGGWWVVEGIGEGFGGQREGHREGHREMLGLQ